MIGKGHSGALVTIVERVTKFTVSAQVNSKSATDVTQATIALLRPFKDVVHTITADNGKEFTYHEKISKALLTDVYFAHPYSSWERGLNRLNSRPGKDLEFKTPDQLMSAHRAALAT